jgi:hypothetical protein
MTTTTVLVVLVARATDPVSYSAPVGIELHVKSVDVNVSRS